MSHPYGGSFNVPFLLLKFLKAVKMKYVFYGKPKNFLFLLVIMEERKEKKKERRKVKTSRGSLKRSIWRSIGDYK